MAKVKAKNKFWFVDFPTSQYKEDVVDLAYANRLEILDSRFRESINKELAISDDDAPKLTKIKVK